MIKSSANYMFIFTLLSSVLLLMSYAHGEEKLLYIDTDASCISLKCHDSMGKKEFVHEIGIDGAQCKRCHELMTSGEHRFRDLPLKTERLCEKCHSRDVTSPSELKKLPPKVLPLDKEAFSHKPFSDGLCTACHDAHESDYYRHLKFEYPETPYAQYSDSTYGLCFLADCHKGLEKVFNEPRTLSITAFRNGNLNLHFRHVNKEKGRTCIVCHDNHYSKSPKIINETFQFGKKELTITYEKTESGGSCNSTCHRIAKYDRYEPAFNYIRTTPRLGVDATKAELELSRERDREMAKKKASSDNMPIQQDESDPVKEEKR
ncbi:MAG: cytochrome c3 family protein [Nitrospiraceae bacterium]|nr:MAG: cytochrome c3 family protein [Nitrospiraceae bacterium]